MKILVPTKRVPDPDQPLQLDASRTAVDLDGVPGGLQPEGDIVLPGQDTQ